ncbi:MAG: decaprenyl-phosphate phosphoribosyltransferase [Armatimonadota bacterium]|nr:decaprenyl-phosphate phosphoribosyltransferase [Armatimonadota bacterium]
MVAQLVPRIPVLRKGTLWAFVRLMRPVHWGKNFLVFAAPLFAGRVLDPWTFQAAAKAFAAFTLAASAVYACNDVLDVRADRRHPVKRNRPVAAGVVSPAQALALAGILAAGALSIAFAARTGLGVAVGLYLAFCLAYSVRLKYIPLVDIMVIAFGFVARPVGGALAAGIVMSPWFLVCVPLLSLLLAAGKRRHEILILPEEERREVLAGYSQALLDQMVAMLSAATLLAYLLYTMEGSSAKALYLTAPLVVYGLFRYLYLVYLQSNRGSPEELMLKDPPLLATVGLWVVAVFALVHKW